MPDGGSPCACLGMTPPRPQGDAQDNISATRFFDLVTFYGGCQTACTRHFTLCSTVTVWAEALHEGTTGAYQWLTNQIPQCQAEISHRWVYPVLLGPQCNQPLITFKELPGRAIRCIDEVSRCCCKPDWAQLPAHEARLHD